MFGGLCGPMGVLGWLVMGVVWTGLIALAVWAIARLFPQQSALSPPPAAGRRSPGAVAEDPASVSLSDGVRDSTDTANIGGR